MSGINDALRAAAKGALKGVLAVEEKELVSIDFNGNKFSSIVDAKTTMVVNGNTVKVLSWYDNECGFSNRISAPNLDRERVQQLQIKQKSQLH